MPCVLYIPGNDRCPKSVERRQLFGISCGQRGTHAAHHFAFFKLLYPDRRLQVLCMPFLGGTSIVRLLFGARFGDAVFSLRVLAVGLPLLFLNYGLTHFLIARDLGKMTLWASITMLGLNVVLDMTRIPRGGGVGAAWATVLTELGLTAWCLAGLRIATASPRIPRQVRAAPRTG